MYRADTVISEEEQVSVEKYDVKSALADCGYPSWAFQKAYKSKQTNTKRSGPATKTRVSIPYVAGISEKIKNSFRSLGIATSC